MTAATKTRRTVILGSAAAGAALITGASGLIVPAQAMGLAPTPTMRGGANNYRPGAPIVERIGGGGFMMTGTVRRAGDGAPLEGIRIQIWAHTTRARAGRAQPWRNADQCGRRFPDGYAPDRPCLWSAARSSGL